MGALIQLGARATGDELGRGAIRTRARRWPGRQAGTTNRSRSMSRQPASSRAVDVDVLRISREIDSGYDTCIAPQAMYGGEPPG